MNKEIHKAFLRECRTKEIKAKKSLMNLKGVIPAYEADCLTNGLTPDPDKIEITKMQIEETEDELILIPQLAANAIKAPDWLSIKMHDKDLRAIYSLGNTAFVEQRIIEQNKLTKYGGILLEDNEAIKEPLEDKVFRTLRKESVDCGFKLDTKMAKEVAQRTAAVVESPIDNFDIITFKNKSLDWKKTYKSNVDEVQWLPERVENHNPIKWDHLTKEEIEASPEHMKMAKYMDGLFYDWFKGSWKKAQRLIFKIGAYAMTKQNFAYKIFFFEGKGGEGKSEVQLFIRKMFNDYSCKSYDPIKPSMGAEMAFVGTQVVFNDDLTDGKLELKHIKSAATGGSINIRPLYQNGGDHTPYSTMIFNTNYGLKTGNDATSTALDSRVFILKFPGKDMRKSDKAKEYKKINPSENRYFMEVFVSRCVDHMMYLIKEEFTDPESAKLNKADAISSTNSVKMFIDDFDPNQGYWSRRSQSMEPLVLTNNKLTTFKELFDYYMNWASDNNEFKVTGSIFREQFQQLTGVEMKVKPYSLSNVVKRWIDLTPLFEKKEAEDEPNEMN